MGQRRRSSEIKIIVFLAILPHVHNIHSIDHTPSPIARKLQNRVDGRINGNLIYCAICRVFLTAE